MILLKSTGHLLLRPIRETKTDRGYARVGIEVLGLVDVNKDARVGVVDHGAAMTLVAFAMDSSPAAPKSQDRQRCYEELEIAFNDIVALWASGHEVTIDLTRSPVLFSLVVGGQRQVAPIEDYREVTEVMSGYAT